MANDRLAYVDSLRGVAILMVIAVHTTQSVTNLPAIVISIAGFGQMGVQLFFVLSSYILCYAMDHLGNGFKRGEFYWRRFFRIAPLYYVGILGYMCLSALENYLHTQKFVTDPEYNLLNVASNITFIHGFVPQANNNIVPGGWSIGTEMAFYVLFPFLFKFCKGLPKSILIGVFSITLMTCTSAVLLLQHFTNLDRHFVYFNLINMLPVFMMGIVYYLLVDDVDRWLPKALPGTLSVILVLLSYLQFVYFFQITLTPVISAAAFVTMLHTAKYHWLKTGGLEKIGKVSYSMYIIHFVFAWQVSRYLNRLLAEILDPSLILAVCLMLTVSFTFLAAYVSEKYIERSGVSLGRWLIQTRIRRETF